jgi:hypothetical protein
MVEIIDLPWPLLKLHRIYASGTKTCTPQNSIKLQYKKGETHNLTLSKDCYRIRKALCMQLAMQEIKWGKFSSYCIRTLRRDLGQINLCESGGFLRYEEMRE